MNTETPRLNRVVMAPLLILYAIAVLLLGAEPEAKESSPAVGQAFRELLHTAVLEKRLLPSITEGRVTAVQPRSAQLLKYIVDDYKSQTLGGVHSVFYCATAGVTNMQNAASGTGQFIAASKAKATYLVTIGSDIARAEMARLVMLTQSADGVRETKSVLYWDDQRRTWRFLSREGPSPSPIKVHSLR